MKKRITYKLKIRLIVSIWFIMVVNALNAQVSKPDDTLTLMTYNLKFASPNFKSLWEERREMQVDLINIHNPDIIATQEGLKKQIDYLEEKLPNYIVVGEGRKGGDDDEHMAIFFKKDKFRLRELNSLALSKTPEALGSGPEINPRMVTWVRLAYKNQPLEKDAKYPIDYIGHWENNKEFYVFNTHFFNGDEPLGRLNAAKLIMESISKLNRFGSWTKERPVFLMGDFNCHPKSEPHKVFVGSTDEHHTDYFKDSNTDNAKEIDWILYRGNVKLVQYKEVDYNENGVYPSDHKPILVQFSLNP